MSFIFNSLPEDQKSWEDFWLAQGQNEESKLICLIQTDVYYHYS